MKIEQIKELKWKYDDNNDDDEDEDDETWFFLFFVFNDTVCANMSCKQIKQENTEMNENVCAHTWGTTTERRWTFYVSSWLEANL